MKDANARRYETLSFDEAIAGNLAVLDTAAFALCREQKLKCFQARRVEARGDGRG